MRVRFDQLSRNPTVSTPPGKTRWPKLSKSLKSGATAFTAGCRLTASISAVLPAYDTPYAPTRPFDHGCATIQSATSP